MSYNKKILYECTCDACGRRIDVGTLSQRHIPGFYREDDDFGYPREIFEITNPFYFFEEHPEEEGDAYVEWLLCDRCHPIFRQMMESEFALIRDLNREGEYRVDIHYAEASEDGKNDGRVFTGPTEESDKRKKTGEEVTCEVCGSKMKRGKHLSWCSGNEYTDATIPVPVLCWPHEPVHKFGFQDDRLMREYEGVSYEESIYDLEACECCRKHYFDVVYRFISARNLHRLGIEHLIGK